MSTKCNSRCLLDVYESRMMFSAAVGTPSTNVDPPPVPVVTMPASVTPASSTTARIESPLSVQNGVVMHRGQPLRLVSYGDLGMLAERSFSYSTFFNQLRRNNINMIRVWPTYGWARSGSPFLKTTVTRNVDGRRVRMSGLDLTRFDASYFNRFEKMLRSAAQNGVFVHITLFNGSELLSGAPWAASPYNPANNVNSKIPIDPRTFGSTSGPIWSRIHLPFINKVVDTVRSFPNVLLELSNEPQQHFLSGGFNQRVAQAVVDRLGTDRANHLLTANIEDPIITRSINESTMNWAISSPNIDLLSFHIVSGSPSGAGTNEYSDVTEVLRKYSTSDKALLISQDGDITQRSRRNVGDPGVDGIPGQRAARIGILAERVFSSALGLPYGRCHIDVLDKGLNARSWGKGIPSRTGYDPRAGNIDMDIVRLLRRYATGTPATPSVSTATTLNGVFASKGVIGW